MRNRSRLLWCTLLLGILAVSCEKTPNQPRSSSPPSANNPTGAGQSSSATPADGKPDAAQPIQLPPGHPPVDARPAPGNATSPAPSASPTAAGATPPPAPVVDGVLHLEGLTLRPPADWVSQPLSSNPMGPVAIFLIPAVEGDTEKTEARITWFPSMRNMPPEPNIDRWLQQVKLPDGSTPKRDQAQITSLESNGAKITILDVSGRISGGGPMMGGTDIADGRMIAAIIDHPQGPHFVKLTGPKATVAHHVEAVLTFIRSAQVK